MASLNAILITGVPCTGKTTLSLAWCKKHGWHLISLNKLVEKKKLYYGIDKKDGAKIVRLDLLEKEANKQIEAFKPNVIVEGHLGCEIKLNVARVLVLRLHPNELEARLKKRNYPKEKIEQNKMAEMLDYCTIRSIENYGKNKVFELDASSKSAKQNLCSLESFVSSKNPKEKFAPNISWSLELYKSV
jgi:adenylate kinase